PQPGQLITLECGQTTSGLLPAALVSVSLGDPRANGVAAWLKLAGKIVRITSSTDEVDHLSAKLRRIWWTCSWHRQHLWRETQGVHQTGSIPGNPSAQPDQRFAFPTPPVGANDQTFRLVVRPDLWGRQARLRLSNVFGTRPVTFDGTFVGLRLDGAAVVPGTNQSVRFGGKDGVTIAPGEWVWSD